MKKLLSIFLSLSMVFSLAACGGASSDSSISSSSVPDDPETSVVSDAAAESQSDVEAEVPSDTEGAAESGQEEASLDEAKESEAASGSSAEITYTEEDLADVGIPIDDVLDYIPEEALYEHTFDEDVDIDSWVDSCAYTAFSAFDEDSWPGLYYSAQAGNDAALVVWTAESIVSSTPYLAAKGDESGVESWESMRNAMLTLGDFIDQMLALESEDYHAIVVLFSSSDEEHKVLLMTFNGEIVYDAADGIA